MTDQARALRTNDSLPTLILASGSPRRRELLRGLGIEFTVRPVKVDESPLSGEEPTDHVLRLARLKSRARLGPGELVLAADTIVVIDGEILGKPNDAVNARQMLRRLAGRRHTVLTGVCLVLGDTQQAVTGVESSDVSMSDLSDEEIRWYVDTGEPLDKAGSYAIQGLGALLVTEVYGNYTNVVGLPLPLTQKLLRRLGYDLSQFRDRSGSKSIQRCT